jgi:transposase
VGTSVEHTPGLESSAIEVRTRKRRSIREKLEIVRETLHAQASVAVIARRHGVNANQVFAWRRQYQRGQLVEGSGTRSQEAVIVPVQIAEQAPPQALSRPTEPSRGVSAGPRIEIELAEGPRLKIWDVSSETLRALIRDLMRPC